MKTAELLFQQNFVELVENNIKTLRCFHVYQIGCYIFCLIFFSDITVNRLIIAFHGSENVQM